MKDITTVLTSIAASSVLILGLTGVALTSTLTLTAPLQQDEAIKPSVGCFEVLGSELCDML